MKKNIIFLILILILSYFLIKKKTKEKKNLPLIVCTTSIIADTVQLLVQEKAVVKSLMGPGVDPHLYKATARDIDFLNNADIIFYNGLHLEGRMIDILENIGKNKKTTYAVAQDLNKNNLRKTEYENIYDPHLWGDVLLWKEVVNNIYKQLLILCPEQKDSLESNYIILNQKLDTLHEWIIEKIKTIPQEKRILITAHDAFGYFGNRYNIRVEGLQGISTDAEIKSEDINRIAEIIINNDIPTIFVEQTISEKYLQAVKNIVHYHNKNVSIGKQLYSDALGEKGSGAENYIDMIKSNVNALVEGLGLQ